MTKYFRVLILALFGGLMLPSAVSLADPLIGGCQVFPPDNPWNTDISAAPVDTVNSDNYIANINANGGQFVHPDFGHTATYGIPYFTVSGTQAKVPVTFVKYGDESDPGPYPFTPTAPIENGGDRHVIAIDTDNCVLYETYKSYYTNGNWSADSGAIFNLNSNALRPDGWTSADAAGLPIFPGLARCSEAMSGQINHALRFTVDSTRNTYIYPATHFASSNTGANYPPMGLRFRLKSSYLASNNTFTGQSLAIVTALNKYGMILADNGSNWFISGERNSNPSCWDNDDLEQLKTIPGTAFEVIVSPAPATVVVPAPSLHLPVDASSISSTQPVLGWNTITSATSYEVQFGSSIPSMTTVASPGSTSFTQYMLPTPLLTGFTYYWRVRAKVNATPTGWSNTRSFTVASPANAAPVRNLFTIAKPVLTWNPLSWAVNYKIQVSGNSSFTSPIQAIVPANVLTYTTPTLTRGYYYWRIQAQDASAQWGSWSTIETFIVDI